MAESVLNQGGLYLDELTRKIRLLHPDFHQLTQEITGDLEDYFQGTARIIVLNILFLQFIGNVAKCLFHSVEGYRNCSRQVE